LNENCIRKVKKRGGLPLKFASPFFTGLPDRLILLPGGRIRFAETKSTGETLSHRQKIVKRQLESLGFKVDVIDDQKTLDEFKNSLDK
jgi:hypothetical protein